LRKCPAVGVETLPHHRHGKTGGQMTRQIASVLSITALLVLGACSNTWEGITEDTEEAGDEVEEETDEM
jgi:predicted small secreted protein